MTMTTVSLPFLAYLYLFSFICLFIICLNLYRCWWFLLLFFLLLLHFSGWFYYYCCCSCCCWSYKQHWSDDEDPGILLLCVYYTILCMLGQYLGVAKHRWLTWRALLVDLVLIKITVTVFPYKISTEDFQQLELKERKSTDRISKHLRGNMKESKRIASA